MINSTYSPKRFEDLNADTCMLNAQGISGTAIAGTATNIDLHITDDHIFTGMTVMANSSAFGDTLTLQVVDKDSLLANIPGISTMYPNYPVLRQFGTNLCIVSDAQTKLTKEGTYPAKVIAGLYIRIIYTSVGSINVDLSVNYELHKVLV